MASLVGAAGAQDTTIDNQTVSAAQGKKESKQRQSTNAKIAYRTLKTTNYTLEVPEKWEVGEETSFGQREIRPDRERMGAKGTAERGSGADEKSGEKRAIKPQEATFSSMTGPGLGKQSWDQLYQTSLFFITRFVPEGTGKMKATPYVLGKTKLGFATCAWAMTDSEGHPLQRHIILKQTNENILALSVKLPPGSSKAATERLERIFQHMVDTATVR